MDTDVSHWSQNSANPVGTLLHCVHNVRCGVANRSGVDRFLISYGFGACLSAAAAPAIFSEKEMRK